MIDLGLSAAEQRAFHRALRQTHTSKTLVTVLDRDEQEIVELPLRITSGAVHVDATQPIDRSLELELVEPQRRFQFIPGSPADFALYADNFLQVHRSIFVAELDKWINVPVFRGPISAVAHSESTISVSAVGKESLGLDPAFAWHSQTIPKGTKVTKAIHDVMAGQGERRFDIPELDLKTRSHISIGRITEPWKVANRLAGSVNRQLFYDGRGVLRLRVAPTAHRWTFSTGSGGTIITRPQKTFDLSKVRNVVETLGPKPEHKRPRLRWVAMPPAHHPLSAQSLARNGEPRYLVERIEMDHANRMIQVRRRAERELDELLVADLTVTFDATEVPHLEPRDAAALDEDGTVTSFRPAQFTIPLVTDNMSIGYLRRVSKRRSRR